MWYYDTQAFILAKETAKKYRNQYELQPKAKKELDHALAFIERYRRECGHCFEVVTCFSSVERVCSICGYEDPDFTFP